MSTTNVGSGSQPRIVTLTANPSLDRTIALTDALRPGEVQLAASAREDAGGKGINVSRAVAAAGVSTVAVLPLAADDPFATALGAAKVPALPVPIDGHSRANLTITDPAGVTTKLNLPGAALTPAGVEDLIAAVVAASEERTGWSWPGPYLRARRIRCTSRSSARYALAGGSGRLALRWTHRAPRCARWSTTRRPT